MKDSTVIFFTSVLLGTSVILGYMVFPNSQSDVAFKLKKNLKTDNLISLNMIDSNNSKDFIFEKYDVFSTDDSIKEKGFGISKGDIIDVQLPHSKTNITPDADFPSDSIIEEGNNPESNEQLKPMAEADLDDENELAPLSINSDTSVDVTDNSVENQLEAFRALPLRVENLAYFQLKGPLKKQVIGCQIIINKENSVRMKPGFEDLGKTILRVRDVSLRVLDSDLELRVKNIYNKAEAERTPEDEQLLNMELCIKDTNTLRLTNPTLDQYIILATPVEEFIT